MNSHENHAGFVLEIYYKILPLLTNQKCSQKGFQQSIANKVMLAISFHNKIICQLHWVFLVVVCCILNVSRNRWLVGKKNTYKDDSGDLRVKNGDFF